MIVILEGADGAGKSTFANQLAELGRGKGYTVLEWHRGVPTRHPLAEYELDLERDYPTDPEERARTLLIADRWHIGQYVYGGMYRDNNVLGNGGLWHVDAFLQSYGAIQLLLTAPDHVLVDRVTKRGDDYIKTDDLPRIVARYSAYQSRYWRTLTTAPDDRTEDYAERVLRYAEDADASAQPLFRHSLYVGPRWPSIVLVGHPKALGRMPNAYVPYQHRACFPPYPNTSGRWLCEMIATTRLLSYEIGLTRVGEEDMSGLLTTLIDGNRSLKIVALGKAAKEHLNEIGFEYVSVPHAAYTWRFQPHEQARYANWIISGTPGVGYEF